MTLHQTGARKVGVRAGRGSDMFNRRQVLKIAGALALGFATTPSILQAADTTSDLKSGAKVFIENLAGEALNSLTQSQISVVDRRQRFQDLMHRYFAFNAIAKWVLGRYWRKANADQRKEYLTLFEKLMIITYADRFEKYSGETLAVEKTEIRGKNDALVHSKLQRPNGQSPIAVVWRVRPKGDSFKVVDVLVEGLSMGITQQKEFSSVIRKNNNNIDGLLSELRKRVNVDT